MNLGLEEKQELVSLLSDRFDAQFSALSEKLNLKLADMENSLLKNKPKVKVKQGTFQSPFFVGPGARNNSDNGSNLSVNSHDEDVKIINKLIKPEFQNEDAKKKIELDQLKSVQSKALLRIPKLANFEQKSGSTITTSHNYGAWFKAFVNYLNVLSPALAEKVQSFVSSIKVEDLLADQSKLDIPELDEDEFPLVTRLAAYGAITDTLSTDFTEFREEEGDGVTANIFATLANLAVYCAPNSQEDRADNLTNFWSMVHGENECITKFAKRMQATARQINNQYLDKQINHDELYAATINGIKKGGQAAAYKAALKSLKLNQSKASVNIKARILWLHRMCNKDKLPQSFLALQKGTVNSASMALSRGGRGGGRGRGGRGGKGQRGGGGKNQRPISGDPTWSDSVYLVTDNEGTDQVAKRIKEKRSNQICFKFAQHGRCAGYTNGNCPFNHEFNIVDTRKNAVPSSSASGRSVSFVEEKKLSSDSAPPNPAPTSVANISHKITDQEPSDVDSEDSDSADSACMLLITHTILVSLATPPPN